MLTYPVPEQYREAFAEEREGLLRRVEEVRAALADGDRDRLRELAPLIRRQVRRGDDRIGGNLHGARIADVDQALNEAYDAAFPLAPGAGVVEVLDTPWPTATRLAALCRLLDWQLVPRPPLGDVVTRVVAAGDVHAMRVLLRTPLSRLSREDASRLLGGLAAADALDAAVVEDAFTADRFLGNEVFGCEPRYGMPAQPPSPHAAAVRPYAQELLWRLLGEGVPDAELPQFTPHGLRFALRGLDWDGEAKVGARLGAAELTPAELIEYVALLRDRPRETQVRAFHLRRPAGDAHAVLPLLGLATAVELLRLVEYLNASEVVRQDRAAILAAAETAGPDGTRRVLELTPCELVSAALGGNRAAVLKRVKSSALAGIAAYGMLPLADGETVLDRYTALREVAKRGPKLGPNRRHSHAAAVEVALEHLAQVAGLPDASALEWDCESRLAEEPPPPWHTGDYTVSVVLDGPDPVISVTSGGKVLKTVPKPVRADARYTASREHQDLLRDQARRMRTGTIERLVATGATLGPPELARLRALPAGAAMLPALLWQDAAGAIGLLGDVDTAGPVTAVHPYHLYASGRLAHWQAEVVRRRLRQPVKQAFRELYLLTAAELAARDASARFAGHTVSGRVAVRLLSGRGWRTHGEYADHQATRPAGDGLTAALRCDFHGYFGMGDVELGAVRFLSGTDTVPLAEVPPVAFSEVMRDLDLVVSVAGRDPDRQQSGPQAQSRAEVLSALIADLGLRKVSVDGAAALVQGSRATYRVHLTSGSIHVEPGGHLCVVPAGFGDRPHRRLFLPFADDDPMTSVILSKVLLLAEDDKITDPSILSQLAALTR
ncbi:DUF4132 domain-containing protein [Catellatospora sp. NPDC049609]|uniref:DUF4132 domain-containing protein n=1 Tax=Catellatospora sp. NPDC049609 TaxID=3155505 RepID=UPI003420B492